MSSSSFSMKQKRNKEKSRSYNLHVNILLRKNERKGKDMKQAEKNIKSIVACFAIFLIRI